MNFYVLNIFPFNDVLVIRSGNCSFGSDSDQDIKHDIRKNYHLILSWKRSGVEICGRHPVKPQSPLVSFTIHSALQLCYQQPVPVIQLFNRAAVDHHPILWSFQLSSIQQRVKGIFHEIKEIKDLLTFSS